MEADQNGQCHSVPVSIFCFIHASIYQALAESQASCNVLEIHTQSLEGKKSKKGGAGISNSLQVMITFCTVSENDERILLKLSGQKRPELV